MLGSSYDGNVLNANFNEDGNLNVNHNWNPDNHNSNIGGRSVEVSRFELCFSQPPNILPMGWRLATRWQYLFWLKASSSQAMRIIIFNWSKVILAVCSVASRFCLSPLADKTNFRKVRAVCWISQPKLYFSILGNPNK